MIDITWFVLALVLCAGLVVLVQWMRSRAARKSPGAEVFSELVLANGRGDAALSFALASEEDLGGGLRPLDAGSARISRLSQLAQGLPLTMLSAASSGESQGQLMRVVINGSMIQAADGDGLRAIARAADGKFMEHARLYEAKDLTKLVNVAAVWQLASIIVAQKHLADINQQLTQISHTVDAILGFLEDERREDIGAMRRRLEQVAIAIQAGELPHSERDKFGDMEQALISKQEQLLAAVRKLAREFVETPHIDTAGSEKYFAELQRRHRRYVAAIGDLALCTRTRLAAYQVWCAYPGDMQLKASRGADLQRSTAKLLDWFESAYMHGKIVAKIHSVDALFSTDNYLESERAKLFKQETIADQVARKLIDQLRDLRYGDQEDGSETCYVRIVDGRVSQVYEQPAIALAPPNARQPVLDSRLVEMEPR